MLRMSFMEHLEELRSRIIRALAGFGVAFLVCLIFSNQLWRIVSEPAVAALTALGVNPPELAQLAPMEAFSTIWVKVPLVVSVFLGAPWILWQVWAFISPGLYRHEKRYITPFMISTVGLFLAGGAFGYKLVYPAALDFLIGYGRQFQPMITIHEYTDLFLTVILGLGVVFELPILVFFLALMGVVSAGWMWRNVRYSILVIFVIAAIITPTTDILNMCIFAAPMVALYLVSIGIAYLVHPKQRKARAERKAQ